VAALVGRGDEVTVLSRSAARAEGLGARAVEWTPAERGDWYRAISGADVVVHLAGEQVVGGRLTDAKKREIERSRLDSTARIVEAICEAEARPSVFVCASAVGFFGPREPDELLDELSPPGEGFLADLTTKWEATAAGAAACGARVVSVRFGIVLGKDGGALREMVRPFRLFAGGPIGSGNQIVSWIHIADAVSVVLLAIDDARVSGPVNTVAPNPVSNRELARGIGRVLSRPSWLPVPAPALSLVLGKEGALPVLTGQRVVPRVLTELGYRFQHPELESALAEALG
jgi:hypothetical protein